jgi:membrane protease YdiL (CAAX protease family)
MLALLWEPVSRTPSSQAGILVAGGTVGGALFYALHHGRHAPSVRLPRSVVMGLAAFLVARAAVEEVVWRLAITGGIAAVAGWPAGLAVGTVGFALAHHPSGREAALHHGATGLVFGLLFLASGRLLCPIAAHAGYNLLVCRASTRR